MEVCNPDIALTEAVCGAPDAPVFVTNFTCLGQTGISDSERIMRRHDMRLSWVSGHASLSAYSMWFCIVFLHQRMSTRNFRLVRPLIQGGCAVFAVAAPRCVARAAGRGSSVTCSRSPPRAYCCRCPLSLAASGSHSQVWPFCFFCLVMTSCSREDYLNPLSLV